MHITLFVLRLNTSEDIQKIVDALTSAKQLYSKYWSETVDITANESTEIISGASNTKARL